MAAAQLRFVNANALSDARFLSLFLYTTLIIATFYDSVIFGLIPS